MMDDADDNDVSNGFEKYHVLYKWKIMTKREFGAKIMLERAVNKYS